VEVSEIFLDNVVINKNCEDFFLRKVISDSSYHLFGKKKKRPLSAFKEASSFASTNDHSSTGSIWQPYCSSRASCMPLPPLLASVVSWRCWVGGQISPTGYE